MSEPRPSNATLAELFRGLNSVPDDAYAENLYDALTELQRLRRDRATLLERLERTEAVVEAVRVLRREVREGGQMSDNIADAVDDVIEAAALGSDAHETG